MTIKNLPRVVILSVPLVSLLVLVFLTFTFVLPVVTHSVKSANAAAPASDVAFNPDLVGNVARVAIPVNLPVESWTLTAKGSSAPLGDFRYKSQLTVHMGLDGKPLSITDGIGAFTGVDSNGNPTGDAIYFTLSGIFQPATGDNQDNQNQNVIPFNAVFIVTGGSGKFTGAFGSGRIKASADVQNNTFVGAWTGTTRRPTL